MDFTFVLNCILALVILMILVLVHELGHYIAGRLLGFTITEFSIGMGPKILKWKRKGILYSLRALPIGGSCMFYGEDPAGGGKVQAEGEEEPAAEATVGADPPAEEAIDQPDKVNFNDMPRWRRAIVLFAGPFMNFLVGIILAIILFGAYGVHMPTQPYIDALAEGRPAAAAGMEVGDVFISVNGVEVASIDEIKAELNKDATGLATVVVERDGERLHFSLEGLYREAWEGNPAGNYMGVTIGSLEPEATRLGFGQVLREAFQYFWAMLGAMFMFLRMLFTGGLRAGDVAGPVGTIGLMAEFMPQGLKVILDLGVLLSVNLGFINLLPIPALDGSRLLFIGIHAVTGKRVPQKVEGIIHAVGLLLLFGLMIFLTFTDISSCIGRMGAP